MRRCATFSPGREKHRHRSIKRFDSHRAAEIGRRRTAMTAPTQATLRKATKPVRLAIVAVTAIGLLVALWILANRMNRNFLTGLSATGEPPMTILLTTPAFKNGEKVPIQYTRDGSNLSP